MSINYRADIDGLRAIAVLTVVFFHAHIPYFSGGYIGVDIFFVISGFLITKILIGDAVNERFSITRFYQSRIKRIFPALFGMLILSTVFTAFFFAPGDFTDYGKSLLAASGFLSNVYFWTSIDYFAGPAEFKPLLHTWSLAVEEQFYLVFPLVLLGLYKIRHSVISLFWLLATLCIASFVVCITLSEQSASTAYYLAHSRAWQFLIGSLLAAGAYLRQDKVFASAIHEIATVLGVALIAFATVSFNKDTVFPGYAALAPTLGAAFVIFGGFYRGNRISQLLGSKPMVWVGLISYSLYLYHWPVFVFAKYLMLDKLDNFETLITLVICFVLAYLSYRFIEVPARKSAIKSKPLIFSVGVAVTLIGIGLGYLIYANQGFPNRLGGGVFTSSVEDDKEHFAYQQCYVFSEQPGHGNGQCALGDKNIMPSFVVWGDSHAHALQPVISATALKNGISGHLVIRTTCPPLIGVDRYGRDFCTKFNEDMLQKLATRPDIKTVIFSARWALAAEQTRYKAEGGEPVPLYPVDASGNMHPSALTELDQQALFETGLKRTTDALTKMGKNIVFVEQIPEIGYNVPMVIASSWRLGRNTTTYQPSREEYLARNHRSSSVMQAIAEQGNVQILNVKDVFCGATLCNFIINNKIVYGDNNHLNVYGAMQLAPQFETLFKAL